MVSAVCVDNTNRCNRQPRPINPQSVRDTPELRKAVAEVQSEVVAFELRLGQSRPLYDALTAIKKGAGWGKLGATRQRVVELQLRDLELGGVALEAKDKARFNEIQQELAQVLVLIVWGCLGVGFDGGIQQSGNDSSCSCRVDSDVWFD